MPRRHGILLAGLAVFCICSAAAGKKPSKDEAREQFDMGVELFEAGKFDQASIAFARAYELRPSFKILYLVGKCENELGHYAASLDAFTRYLAEGGDQIEKKRQAEVRTEIERLSSRIGTVAVKTDIDGLIVFLDGRKVGTSPLGSPLVADIGEHEIQLKRGVEEVHREIVKVAGGQRVEVEADFEEKARAGTETSTAAAKAPAEASADRPERLWTWVAGGVGGAAGVAAIVTGALTLSKAKDVTSDCAGDVCQSSARRDADSAKALGYATDALIAVAGVGIAAGIVLFFVEPKWSKGESAVAFVPAVAPSADGGSILVSGRF